MAVTAFREGGAALGRPLGPTLLSVVGAQLTTKLAPAVRLKAVLVGAEAVQIIRKSIINQSASYHRRGARCVMHDHCRS